MSENRTKEPRPLVPVGVERVIVAAAVDPAFCTELLTDRQAAIGHRGLTLSPSEMAMLLAIPEEQLLQAIQKMDTSEANLKRRAFLGAVAASAATVIAGEALSGCVKGTRPESETPVQTAGVRPDPPVDAKPDMMVAKPDMMMAAPKAPGVTRGIRPQRPLESKQERLQRLVPPPTPSGTKGGINPDLPEGVNKTKKPGNR